MIADLQSERMDEQRAQLPGLVTRRSGGAASGSAAASGSNSVSISARSNKNVPAPDDAFLDMLMRCQVIFFKNSSRCSCKHEMHDCFIYFYNLPLSTRRRCSSILS